MARIIQVIETVSREGRGIEGDPVRSVIEFYSPDGELLGFKDPLAPKYDRCTGEWVIQRDTKYRVEF